METDTTVAQMIKDVVSEDDFRDWIIEQHGGLITCYGLMQPFEFILFFIEYLEGKDIDKSRSLIEDAILNNEPFLKVIFCNITSCYI